MKCYKCGSRLAANLDVCSKCGQNVRLYKKIIKTANAYYNLGLTKAQVRDLSGASVALRMCLSLDKKNIHARNLLGLIYMEIGEISLALREWVISRNLQMRNNPADRYLKEIQSNQNRLEELDQNIKKYNLALRYAQTDGKDLAIIQLKKVINVNPKMICAQLLLALLYMKDQKYDRAEKTLKACLKIDKGNTTANRYLDELQILRGITGNAAERKEEKTRRVSRQDVIIPVHTRAVSSYLMTMLYIFIGIIIGFGALHFVAMPDAEKKFAEDYNNKLLVYQEEVQSGKAQIDNLNGDIDDLEQEIKNLEAELAMYVKSVDDADQERLTIVEAYDLTLEMMQLFYEGDYISVSGYYEKLTPETIDSDKYRQVYDYIMVQHRQQMFDTCYNNGIATQQGQNPHGAIPLLEAALRIMPESADAWFWTGVCYHQTGDKATADTYYNYVIEHFPGTPAAAQAEAQKAQP